MQKTHTWQLQEAKNKFSQVAEEAALYGPQCVTKHGKEALVIMTVSDYEKLQKPETDIVQFLASSPMAASGIITERTAEGGRDIAL